MRKLPLKRAIAALMLIGGAAIAAPNGRPEIRTTPSPALTHPLPSAMSSSAYRSTIPQTPPRTYVPQTQTTVSKDYAPEQASNAGGAGGDKVCSGSPGLECSVDLSQCLGEKQIEGRFYLSPNQNGWPTLYPIYPDTDAAMQEKAHDCALDYNKCMHKCGR